jgi:hypothetical protein
MDPGSADDYWLAEFVGEEGSWVSKYLQDINIVDEGNHSVEESPKPVENTISTEFSSMSAPNSSSLVIQKCHPVTRGPERIPFDRKWELLKSEIERLYITENVLLRDIIGIMKEKYDFDAM